MNKIAVVIPAYNEAENIPILLDRIYRAMQSARVIVVDDSFPDQVMTIEKIIATRFPQAIHIIRGKKGGRGSAVLEGMQEALKDKRITHMFEMDADLAHDPADFHKFLEKSEKFDMIVGSRYMKRSHIRNWSLKRLVASKLVNAFLTVWLGVRLTDYTNGFRLYSRRAVKFLLKQNLKETGFIALSEIAYALKRGGCTIAEVPITFTDRIYGSSSAGLSEHLNALKGAIRIRLTR